MQRVKYFNCPGGCGATLKVRVDLKRSYVCPGCGKAFDLEALKPYRARHKDLKPTVTTTQCFFTFKPDKKARVGAEIYIDRWYKGQREMDKRMSGKGRRRF